MGSPAASDVGLRDEFTHALGSSCTTSFPDSTLAYKMIMKRAPRLKITDNPITLHFVNYCFGKPGILFNGMLAAYVSKVIRYDQKHQ